MYFYIGESKAFCRLDTNKEYFLVNIIRPFETYNIAKIPRQDFEKFISKYLKL